MLPSPAENDTQLIACVRHDLNNMLTVLLGQTQLLLREELSETAKQRAKTIAQTVKCAAILVDQLRKAEHSE